VRCSAQVAWTVFAQLLLCILIFLELDRHQNTLVLHLGIYVECMHSLGIEPINHEIFSTVFACVSYKKRALVWNKIAF